MIDPYDSRLFARLWHDKIIGVASKKDLKKYDEYQKFAKKTYEERIKDNK